MSCYIADGNPDLPPELDKIIRENMPPERIVETVKSFRIGEPTQETKRIVQAMHEWFDNLMQKKEPFIPKFEVLIDNDPVQEDVVHITIKHEPFLDFKLEYDVDALNNYLDKESDRCGHRKKEDVQMRNYAENGVQETKKNMRN